MRFPSPIATDGGRRRAPARSRIVLSVGVLLVAGCSRVSVDPSAGPDAARLLICVAEPDRWEVAVERDGSSIDLDHLDVRLAPGDYRLRASLRESGGYTESASLKLEPRRVYVYAVGGEPVRLSTSVGDRRCVFSGIPGGGPLCWSKAGLLRFDAAAPDEQLLDVDSTLETSVHSEEFRAFDGNRLIVANPYDVPLRCESNDGASVWEFGLPAAGVRFLPTAPSTRWHVRTYLPDDGRLLDDARFEIPGGISLFTIGAATAYRWEGRWNADAKRDPKRLPPARITAIVGDEFTDLRLPTDDERLSGRVLLVRRHPRRGECRLIVAAAAPLLPPPADEASPLSLTLHPDVRLTELTPPPNLAGRSIRSAASAGERIFVVVDDKLCDFAGGAALHDGDIRVSGIAWTAEGGVLLSRDARLARLVDRSVETGASVFDPTLRIAGSTSRAEAYLYGGKGTTGLFVVDGEAIRVQFSDLAISAVGDSTDGLLLGCGRTIELARREGREWRRTTVVSLPDGPAILGLQPAAGGVLFATAGGVYRFSEGIVVPLAIGLGGPLSPYRGGTLVLDHRTGRLFFFESAPAATAAATPRG